jgi:hypothetical protein
MAHAFIVFDFGTNEDASQKAWHRVEGWKQGFRLGNKLQMKFERTGNDKAAAGDAKAQGKKKEESPDEKAERVRVLIQLDFSDHEKLSFQQWLERIQKEEAFKPASSKVVRQGDIDFSATQKLFDSLD